MKTPILLLLLFPILLNAQHTFSIVAVDSVTGEIGSAGATCGDSIIWPGTPGAKIISDVLPGKGAIHTQSYYLQVNQNNARSKMQTGLSPKDIIDWLKSNDADGDNTIRQYGIVDFNNGHPRSAAFTGSGCFDYKNHLLGKNYAIQGNILLSQAILDSMESGFKRSRGNLADKLMAAMLGAKIIGADSRCLSNGTSSLSAFIRMAKPTDSPTKLFLDINIAATSKGAEPITKLHEKYLVWKQTTRLNNEIKTSEVQVFPNPVLDKLSINLSNQSFESIELVNIMGSVVWKASSVSENLELNMSEQEKGIYILRCSGKKGMLNLKIQKI